MLPDVFVWTSSWMFEMRTGEEQDPKIPNLNKRKHMETLWNMSVAEPMKPETSGISHYSGWKFSCQGASSLYRALEGYRMDVFVAAHMHSPVVLRCFAQHDGWQTTSDWTLFRALLVQHLELSMVLDSGCPADGCNLDTPELLWSIHCPERQEVQYNSIDINWNHPLKETKKTTWDCWKTKWDCRWSTLHSDGMYDGAVSCQHGTDFESSTRCEHWLLSGEQA